MLNHQDREYFFKRITAMRMSEQEKQNRKKHMTVENLVKIRSYKDIHRGERCFIIGGSPSLDLLDLTKLNNEYTFTVNRGYKLQEKGLKHSTYHLFADKNLVEQDKVMNDFPQDFCKKFFVNANLEFPDEKFDTTYFTISLMKAKKFTSDLTQDLTEGYTVVHHAIQIAYYMGFDKIYLIGIDIDFSNVQGHAYEEFDSEKERQISLSIKEENVMLKYIGYAADFLQSNNRKIYNASPMGAVNCMPRVKYEDLF